VANQGLRYGAGNARLMEERRGRPAQRMERHAWHLAGS